MGLRSLMRPRAVEVRGQATTWGDWPGDTSPTWSGQHVDRASAVQLSAVYGCVRFIADSIATLPVDIYRKRPDGSREEINAPFWLMQPTADLEYTSWATQVLTSLLIDGNAYVGVMDDPETGRIVELVPFDAKRVQIIRVDSKGNQSAAGRKVYLVNGSPWSRRMLHLKGAMLAGSDVGLSPLECARQTIGLGLATVEHGARYFGRGIQPGGVVESPASLSPEFKKDLAQQIQRKHAGGKSQFPLVLDGGATWKPPAVTNEQAQFLETRGMTSAEIAGQVFLVDPSELGIPVQGSNLTYANLQERSTRRVQVTFLPWIIRVEQALSSLLARPQYVKINVDGYLRGSTSQRWETYLTAAQINTAAVPLGMPPVLTTAEMREFEDMGPVEDYTAPDPAPAMTEGVNA